MDQRDAILTRLLDLHPKKIDLSLGRTERLLAAMGHPERRLPPIIHVAGTNGKGSTLAFLRAMLESAGLRAHVYTSPHLLRFNERIRLAGTLVDDDRLRRMLEDCERANGAQPVTFFEITTVAAFALFAEEPADWLLLETGLGGRYDSTNVIEAPKATIITSISHDHHEFLGDTIEKIAYEKAGIFKRGVPAIIGFQQDAARNVLEREARRVGAPTFIAGEDFHIREENGRLVYEDEKGLLDLPLPRLPGRHQQANAAGAIAALRAVAPEIGAEHIEAGLLRAEWPARLQLLSRGRVAELVPPGSEVWLDGGHNDDGGRVLAEAMAEFEEKSARPLVFVCGAQVTKDIGALLKHFAGLAREVVAVPVEGEHKSWPPEEIAALACAEGMRAAGAGSVEEALSIIARGSYEAPPRILIAGSLYLAAGVLALNGSVIE
ncbi:MULTISPECIES: bifunctional folylpolyglutamate synthase/dihydrofolate synthase [Methylosinus]|uniref:tetrahydrofolate synthase n=1 Tax=Methylosinus trichosporium (strain ATCC 35070 / NCIMB 11131 / UNIQEM 75 / OB3b) TaxID=595536 RepID=A0A2D2D293_METT3|nr:MULTISPECIES: folylpolyglutamate synthase/dihydrofolate synthase family protein [Methylosinus]ATQ69110.1 bifunctional folylpolyglutamate synthase/dihydrofolate synthase [Methylosinus trichosporium OB3b]OBS54217.1 bifunctional folylpolyglutamate synthase/dihydrofolate synthase [Methylosinus sp. 3S-1]